MNTPDANVVKDRYRRLAADYDSAMSFLDRVRAASFEHLDLKPGETVLDLGCGTGISFERLHRDVGPQGRIIGVEFSPEMLEMARRRVELNGWRNVTLIEGDANTVDIPGPSMRHWPSSCPRSSIRPPPFAEPWTRFLPAADS